MGAGSMGMDAGGRDGLTVCSARAAVAGLTAGPGHGIYRGWMRLVAGMAGLRPRACQPLLPIPTRKPCCLALAPERLWKWGGVLVPRPGSFGLPPFSCSTSCPPGLSVSCSPPAAGPPLPFLPRHCLQWILCTEYTKGPQLP